ncbi:uncharacterized protein LOC103364254 [Stegastes partitus]|uniref:Uncharacterized protein LOC103364254 n=1 Tax=Stegastes partitus TaxID=144197 RepID=A0A9Y4K9D4_9TELE|nr:PREDICTED: uncharacterized protein LOC103364254 [Stegastes partitus]
MKDVGMWRPVEASQWTLKAAGLFCLYLRCGTAVSVGERGYSHRPVWLIESDCVRSGIDLRECLILSTSSSILNLICSDVLVQPNISVSSSMDGVFQDQQQRFQVSKGSNLTITCSVQPQFPGGSFQLRFTSSSTAFNYSQPAVNHSAHFLFPAAEPAHQGNYSCVYHVYTFSLNFSSESRVLSVAVPDPTALIIRGVVVPLTLLVVNVALYFYCKATRGQRPSRQQNMELVDCNLNVSAAEEGLDEKEGAQGAE